MVAVEDLHVELAGAHILRGVTMQVSEGETCAVVGESGCGKSVLMKTIMGLIPATSGRILISDLDTTDFTEREYNERVRPLMAIVFQRGALWDSMTVRENIDLVLRIRYALDPAERSRRAMESLELVDLADAADKYPRELSGGMNKRAAMARAIATQPRYIIYDEPTTGLDPVLAGRTNRLIKNLNEDLGVTALVVTHDVRHVPEFADRVVMISGGTVAAEVPADELWNTEEPTLARFIRGRDVREETGTR